MPENKLRSIILAPLIISGPSCSKLMINIMFSNLLFAKTQPLLPKKMQEAKERSGKSLNSKTFSLFNRIVNTLQGKVILTMKNLSPISKRSSLKENNFLPKRANSYLLYRKNSKNWDT